MVLVQANKLKQAAKTGDLPSLQAILVAGVNVNLSLDEVYMCA